jgi:hypothetical protein
VCTYKTELLSVSASAKTALGWMAMTDASVYFDHPVHHPSGHALLIDVRNPARGPAARLALELDPASARALAESILRTLDAVDPALVEPPGAQNA